MSHFSEFGFSTVSFVALPVPQHTIFHPSSNMYRYFWPHFGLSWPAGAEFGKMTYTIVFVSARRNFKDQLVKLAMDPFKVFVQT